MIQVGAVLEPDRDGLAVRVFQNPRQLGIEEYLAVVRQLDALKTGTVVDELLKVLEPEKAAADRWMNCA